MDCLKRYYIKYGIGKSKYVVNYHNGIKQHNDGSKFYDVAIFKSIKEMDKFVDSLTVLGYIPE